MKKRRIAGVLALVLFITVLSGCQLIGKLTGRGGRSKVQTLPLPTETPKFHLFAETDVDHLKTLPVPEGYTVYDHTFRADTTANPKEDYVVRYNFSFRVAPYTKVYETRCELSLAPGLSGFQNGFNFDLFKHEGTFLWRTLAKTHNLDENALAAGLKDISDRVAAKEKPDGVLGYTYTSKDMPGIELEYQHTEQDDQIAASLGTTPWEVLLVKLYNEIPKSVEEQGKGLTQLADSVLSALAEQKVPIETTSSKFFYIKTDRSDEAVIITDLSRTYTDYGTYADFSNISAFELKGSMNKDFTPRSKDADEDFLQKDYLYTGVGEPILSQPVDPEAFSEEARAFINQWKMSDETRSQLLGFIDKGTIKTGASDFLHLDENIEPDSRISYEFSTGYSVSLRRSTYENVGITGGLNLPSLPDNPSDLLPDDTIPDATR